MNLILMDQELKKLESKLNLIEINTATAREHVGGFEWIIGSVVERAGSILTVLPYTVLPR